MTKPQREQLRRLNREAQPNYGASTVRVQNTLVRNGWARFVDDRGRDTTSEDAHRCVITEAGRAMLVSGPAKETK